MLTVGHKAPDFTGVNQDGVSISLQQFRGKKVVLYFYPKDNTPGCTAQACSLNEGEKALQKAGFQVIGVSTDSVKSHKKFEEKFNLGFPLVADEDKAIVNAYGVWGPKKFMGKTYDGITRTTFLIDEAGTIRHIITKPDTKNHAAEVLKAWDSIQ